MFVGIERWLTQYLESRAEYGAGGEREALSVFIPTIRVTAFRSKNIEHGSYIRATTGLWRRGT